MPEYSFICDPKKDGCGEAFSFTMSISQYSNKKYFVCPFCKKRKSVHRFYKADNVHGSIRLVDSEIQTLGHLAHRNFEKKSADERAEIVRKNNAYKWQNKSVDERNAEHELPQGMTRIEKPTDVEWVK